jgi:hypothetical protein
MALMMMTFETFQIPDENLEAKFEYPCEFHVQGAMLNCHIPGALKIFWNSVLGDSNALTEYQPCG